MAEPTVPSHNEETAVSRSEETRAQEQYVQPQVDIFENEDGLTVMADMPGVDANDLEVNVEGGILTLKGTVREREMVEPYYREYRLLSFFRQFQLSDKVDVGRISADLQDGVLTLQLPKSEAAKPRRIEVQTRQRR